VPGGRARERAGRGDDGRRPLGVQPAALELTIERETFDRIEGRRVFGQDAEGYHRARPGHPDRVYEILEERCGLGPGAVVLEIGSGTGQATRPLLERGAARLIAIEPDPELAAFLPTVTDGRPEILHTTLEEAALPPATFDLAVAASSFHWVDTKAGLAVVRRALRPGGWWAMWWTHFGDDSRPDPFRDAIDHLMTDLPSSPGATGISRDPEAALAALADAGFEQGEFELIRSSHEWDAEGIRGLFATFSPIARLEPSRRDEILDEIARIARDDFRDRVVKPVLTRLYTAQSPADA
jgi:SAM-dependent methyltransferase